MTVNIMKNFVFILLSQFYFSFLTRKWIRKTLTKLNVQSIRPYRKKHNFVCLHWRTTFFQPFSPYSLFVEPSLFKRRISRERNEKKREKRYSCRNKKRAKLHNVAFHLHLIVSPMTSFAIGTIFLHGYRSVHLWSSLIRRKSFYCAFARRQTAPNNNVPFIFFVPYFNKSHRSEHELARQKSYTQHIKSALFPPWKKRRK